MTTAIAVERVSGGVSWPTLLRSAALAQCLGLGIAAALLRDVEAGAIAFATLVGFLLLRFRGGTIGAVLLGLVFADTGFFTGAAALTNLIDRAEPVPTIGPGALAAIALPGLIASAVTVWQRRHSWTPSRFAAALPVLAFAGFIGLSLASVVLGTAVTTADGTALQLDMKSVSYSSAQLDAPGRTMTIRVTNHDLFWHTFTIPELGVDLRVPVGGRKEITFTAPPGAYTYLCTVPGHAAQMHGTLTVR